MKLPRFHFLAAIFAFSVSSALLCAGTPEPDFQLPDSNPNSPRFQATISPRQYQERISAYYFGLDT
jgi:hypothetical protein